MIRVLHVVGSMNRGGIETFIMNLYRHIDRSKIQFDFAVHTTKECDYNSEIKALGGRIFYITPRSKNFLKHIQDLRSLFKSNPELQIVHQHVSSLTYINPLKIAKLEKVKTRIVHSHSTEAESKFHYLLHKINQKKIHKYANNFYSCSNNSSKWLYENTKVNENYIVRVNNAIEIKKFAFNELKRQQLRVELGIGKEFVIGHVGRFTEVKNHKFLIKIFNEIEKKIGNVKLLLVGNGPLVEEILENVKQRGIANKVIFVGSVPNVEDYLNVMDAFVFPSLFEGLGMALIEAQAAGLRCYTSLDVVPSAVNVTDMVQFLSLSDNPTNWAEIIIDDFTKDNYKRVDLSDKVGKAGYNINSQARILQENYIRSFEGSNHEG